MVESHPRGQVVVGTRRCHEAAAEIRRSHTGVLSEVLAVPIVLHGLLAKCSPKNSPEGEKLSQVVTTLIKEHPKGLCSRSYSADSRRMWQASIQENFELRRHTFL